MSKALIEYANVIDSLHQTPDYQNDGYPMVRIVDINNDFLDLSVCLKVSEEKFYEHNKNHTPQKGDIIITRVGSFGMLGYVDTDEPFCLGQNIAIISPKIDSHFLYYYLKSPYIQNIIHGNSGGSSYKCISLEEIKKLPVKVEGLDCEKIGKVLYLIDAKIQTNKKTCLELESMAKTIYDYWFTQFDFPNAEGKPYRSSGGKMVWNEQLKREIPEGWECCEISTICEIISGYPFQSSSYTKNGQYRLITIKNVQNNGISLDVDNYISSLPENLPDYCVLSQGDILMSLTGNVGRVGVMFADDCLLNQRVALISPKLNNIKPFLYIMFRSSQIRSTMENIATGTSQKNLSPVDTGKILFPCNDAVLTAFSETISRMYEKMILTQKENMELSVLRNWLLPMLMNGQATIE